MTHPPHTAAALGKLLSDHGFVVRRTEEVTADSDAAVYLVERVHVQVLDYPLSEGGLAYNVVEEDDADAEPGFVFHDPVNTTEALMEQLRRTYDARRTR